MVGRFDRRTALLAGAGLVIAGCGGGGQTLRRPRPAVGTPNEAATLLRPLLELRRAALQGYARTPDLRVLAERERADVAALEVLTTARETPPRPRSMEDALRLEEILLATAIDVIPRLRDLSQRRLVTEAFTADAGHAAWLRTRLGRAAVPLAFVSGERA